MPGPEHVAGGIRQRARHEDAPRAAERQQVRSFFSSTMDLRAISRAAARCAAETRTRFSRSSGT